MRRRCVNSAAGGNLYHLYHYGPDNLDSLNSLDRLDERLTFWQTLNLLKDRIDLHLNFLRAEES